MMLQKEPELRKLQAQAAVGLVVYLTVTHLFLLEMCHMCDCNVSEGQLCIHSDCFQQQTAHLIPV